MDSGNNVGTALSLCVCAPAGLLSMKRAVLQWAGQEQAGSVQLLPFLESNCRSWSNLAAAAGVPGLCSIRTLDSTPCLEYPRHVAICSLQAVLFRADKFT
jgi:hypothetical protein